MKHEELSEKIIGAAQAVLYELKPGLDEKLYACPPLEGECAGDRSARARDAGGPAESL